MSFRIEKLAAAAIAVKTILIPHSGAYPTPIFTKMPPRLELMKAPTWCPIRVNPYRTAIFSEPNFWLIMPDVGGTVASPLIPRSAVAANAKRTVLGRKMNPSEIKTLIV